MKCWCLDLPNYQCIDCEKQYQADRLSTIDKIRLRKYKKLLDDNENETEIHKFMIYFMKKDICVSLANYLEAK